MWGAHALWGGQVAACPLPGEGASTPAVWGDAVFVTTQDKDTLNLVKIGVKTGREEWTRQVGTGKPEFSPPKGKDAETRRHQKFNPYHNMASPSPVTDGEVVVVHFGNGIISNVSSYNGTSLTFTVPYTISGYGSQQLVNGQSYNVSVTNSSGLNSNSLPFTITGANTYGSAPSITSQTGPTTSAMIRCAPTTGSRTGRIS